RGDGERCRQLGIQAYLTKPIARADLVEARGTGRAGTASAPGAADLVTRHSIAESRHALRVLLAEDNPVNQQVATAMLLKRGHHVDVASNGREAVDAVAREPYDVILMDIQMPEMDGFEATEQIRGLPQGRTLPIIALTAHALSGERERCLARVTNLSTYAARRRPHSITFERPRKAVGMPNLISVMVVDDDPVSSAQLGALAKAAGYEVQSAPNGREAWELLQLARVPIVISDWYMPEMDGPELCRRIRARTREPYVYFILVT